MRKRKQPRDWFAVVATDVFCGLLCAAVVFDATARKLPYYSPEPAGVSISYRPPANANCENYVVGVLFSGDSAKTFYTTRNSSSARASECELGVQVPDVSDLKKSAVMLIDGSENLTIHLTDEVTDADATCYTKSGECE